MDYIKFGNTGMDVSRICLGCMGFGDSKKWIHKWVLKEDDSRIIIKAAIEKGISFFDTANVYSGGTSEEYLGRALNDYANRDEIVIATKVYGKNRSETDEIIKEKYDATKDIDDLIIERVRKLAEKYGVKRAQIALAWLFQKDNIVSPIVGATKVSHLEDSIAARSINLSKEDVIFLEELYEPHRVVGAN